MSKARILVVDDDTDIVRLVQGYLRKAGFELLGRMMASLRYIRCGAKSQIC